MRASLPPVATTIVVGLLVVACASRDDTLDVNDRRADVSHGQRRTTVYK